MAKLDWDVATRLWQATRAFTNVYVDDTIGGLALDDVEHTFEFSSQPALPFSFGWIYARRCFWEHLACHDT
jgi:hypothetical protein